MGLAGVRRPQHRTNPWGEDIPGDSGWVARHTRMIWARDRDCKRRITWPRNSPRVGADFPFGQTQYRDDVGMDLNAESFTGWDQNRWPSFTIAS
jgi:hypothetical protein